MSRVMAYRAKINDKIICYLWFSAKNNKVRIGAISTEFINLYKASAREWSDCRDIAMQRAW